MENRDDRTNHTLSTQRRWARTSTSLATTLIDNPDQAGEHSVSTLKHPRTRQERLDNCEATKTRILVKEAQ